ncbi:MAG: hypothetical protein QMC52_06355 [Candidatus Poseidoniaceae archaeon]|jgi:hypothetical protein
MTDDKIKSGGEMWDERFSSDEYAYGKEANIWLSERVSQIDPPPNNRALFPADGEGRNAVWAARIGWNSEVFDLSVVGKQKCHLLAQEHAVTVDYEVDDLALRVFPQQSYDLIACSWFHTPSEIRKVHMPRMLHSLKSGGHFIMEGYHTSQMPLHSGGPKSLDLLFDLDEVLGELVGEKAPQMNIIHTAITSTVLDESVLHKGQARVVRIHLQRD